MSAQFNESAFSEIWPALIIGLGGMGTDTVRMVKYRMHDEWKRLHSDQPFPGIIQFLAVDTTLNTDPGAQDADREAPLGHDEYAYLGGFSASTVLAHLDNHPLIKRWWPSEAVSGVGRIHSGARQMRVIGRISFYRRYRTFWEKLTPKLYEMVSIRHIQDVEDAGHKVPREQTTRHIYIVSSLLGGTGAGMLLDVAHRIRAEFQDNVFITAILYMPSILVDKMQSTIQKGRIQSNAYATLKEIEYFQSGNLFRAQYPGEDEIITSRPFDRIYLLEKENTANKALTGHKAIPKMAADFIYLETMTKLGSKIRERDVNISSESFHGYGSRAFSSFGVSILDVKTDELQDYAAYRLKRRALKEIKGPNIDVNDKGGKEKINKHVDEIEQMIEGIIKTIVEPNEQSSSPTQDNAPTGIEGTIPVGDGEKDNQNKEDLKAQSFETLDKLLEKHFSGILKAYGIDGLRMVIQALIERSRQGKSKLIAHQRDKDALDGEIQSKQDKLEKVKGRKCWSLIPKANRECENKKNNEMINISAEISVSKEKARRQDEYIKHWNNMVTALQYLVSDKKTLDEWSIQVQKEIDKASNEAEKVWSQQGHSHHDHITSIVNRHYAESLTNKMMTVGKDPTLEGKIEERKTAALLNSLKVRKIEQETGGLLAEYFVDEKEWGEAMSLLENTCRSSARDWIQTKVKNEYDILGTIEEHWTDSEQRIQQFIERCKPFWRIELDTSEEADQTNLEDVKLVAISDSRSKSMAIIRRKDEKFEPVNTGDPRLFAAVHISHGLNPRFIRDIEKYYQEYCSFKQNRDIPVHLDKRWTDMPDIIISSKADCGKQETEGESPESLREER